MKEHNKSFLTGIIVLIIGLLLVTAFLGNIGTPINGLLLLKWGKTTQGYILDTEQDYEENNKPFYTIWYEYKVGTQKYEKSYTYNGELKDKYYDIKKAIPIEVIFFPKYPSISRIKGNAPTTLLEWFLREFCLGMVFYGIVIYGSYSFIKNGFKERKQSKISYNSKTKN